MDIGVCGGWLTMEKMRLHHIIMHLESFLFINICSLHDGISPFARRAFTTMECTVQPSCTMQGKASQVGGPCI